MTTTPITKGLTSGSAYEDLPQWVGIPNAQAGDPYNTTSSANGSDRSVQVGGTFGAAGSVNIEGSNDGGLNYILLTDPLGNALTFTSAGMKAITELPQRIRPRVTAGDGTTAINVYLFCKGVHL